jgi:3-deoxy-7-phosphoheptulonate synthase
LPVIVDPSHGTGHAYLVADMAAAAVAAGADGLIIEVHPDPENALSDGYQSLNLPQFHALMQRLARVAHACDRILAAPAKECAASRQETRATGVYAHVS